MKRSQYKQKTLAVTTHEWIVNKLKAKAGDRGLSKYVTGILEDYFSKETV